jgi:tyrosine-specific transport protein
VVFFFRWYNDRLPAPRASVSLLNPQTYTLPTRLSGIYGINLISGLLLAEVAIKQREAGGGDVPSSFKEFAESSLQCPTTAQFISSISVFVNWCILAFALPRAGQMVSTILPSGGLDPTLSTAGVAAALTALVSTQTNHSLSRVASCAVAVLFASFAALLLPGLASVHDPVGAFFQPGTTCAGDVGCALSSAAPVFLSCMIFQNIVPSVTRLLDYDRQKTTLAISIGSSVPLLMYSALNLAALGGGLDVSISTGGPVLTAFAAASLLGSSIGGTMSLSEELENAFLKSEDVSYTQDDVDLDATTTTATTASLPSVLMALAPPLVAGSFLASGGGATAALDVAGGYCSPLLYGLLPVVMAAKQRQDEKNKEQNGYNFASQNLVPGGMASLGVLGAASSGFIFQNLVSDVSDMMSTVGFV